MARDGERGLRLATRLEKKSGSKNGHNNCGVTGVRGGESGGGGEWTLAERGVSKMIVGPSATLLESWLSWELGGRGGAGSWGWSRDLEARRLQMTFARSVRLRCQLAGLSAQNWTPPCWRPARCLKIPRQSLINAHLGQLFRNTTYASLHGTNSLLHLTQAPRHKREGKHPWTWPFPGQILKRNPVIIGPERPTPPNQAGWRFVLCSTSGPGRARFQW